MASRSASVRLSSASEGRPGPGVNSVGRGTASGAGAAVTACREASPRRMESRNLAMFEECGGRFRTRLLVWCVEGCSVRRNEAGGRA